MEDEPVEIQCSSFDELVNHIRGTKPEYFVQADDPKVLKLGWSTEKYWYTIPYENLRQEKNDVILTAVSTEEGRRNIRDALYSVSQEEKRQEKPDTDSDPIWGQI